MSPPGEIRRPSQQMSLWPNVTLISLSIPILPALQHFITLNFSKELRKKLSLLAKAHSKSRPLLNPFPFCQLSICKKVDECQNLHPFSTFQLSCPNVCCCQRPEMKPVWDNTARCHLVTLARVHFVPSACQIHKFINPLFGQEFHFPTHGWPEGVERTRRARTSR